MAALVGASGPIPQSPSANDHPDRLTDERDKFGGQRFAQEQALDNCLKCSTHRPRA